MNGADGGHGGRGEREGEAGLALISVREKKGPDQHLPPDLDLPRGRRGGRCCFIPRYTRDSYV
jgi:hypothetical protein